MDERLVRLDLIQKDIKRKEEEAYQLGYEYGQSTGILLGVLMGCGFWLVLEVLITLFTDMFGGA